MNKKGMTLVELLAVLVLITLISMLTFPNIRKLMNSNQDKQFTTYEDLMINYAKSLPVHKYVNNSGEGRICLKELNMKKINESMECNGYVKIQNNTYTSYLLCSQDGTQVWKSKVNNSTSWSIPEECR